MLISEVGPSIKVIDLGDKHSSEVFSTFMPDAPVVKAFNHLDVAALVEPELSGGQRVLFYSGDDAAAKTAVRTLIENTGFFSRSIWVRWQWVGS